MIAHTPKTQAPAGPQKCPQDALFELLGAKLPELSFDGANPDGITASIDRRLGSFNLTISGGTREARLELARKVATEVETSIELGVETDEVDGDIVAMATRLHLSPRATSADGDAVCISIGTIFESWGVEPPESAPEQE